MKTLLRLFGTLMIILGLLAATFVLGLARDAPIPDFAAVMPMAVAYVITGLATSLIFFAMAEILEHLERLQTRR